MSKQIRHAFFINAGPDAVEDALLTAAHIQNWWTREVRIEAGKGIFGWGG